MSAWLASGSAVDVIIALIALEALALFALRRRSGKPRAMPGGYANLLAGAFLLLALRAALTGAGWMWIAGCLLAAFAAHGADVAARWRS